MTENWVFDSSALVAYLEGRPAAEAVDAILRRARDRHGGVLVHEINVCEVMTVVLRKYGSARLVTVESMIAASSMQRVSTDFEFLRGVAELRARTGLGLGDGVVGALAMQRKATLVTTDGDFRRLRGLVKLRILPAR